MDNNSYAVGWLALALINANIAHIKGHSRLLWFPLSLFIGPLATLMLVFVTPRPVPYSKRPNEELKPAASEEPLG